MSLLMESIKEWYKTESAPPDDADLVEGAEQVKYSLGTQRRWGTEVTVVYRLGDEFVAVTDVEPATEEQSWGDYGDPDIYAVTQRVKVVTSTVYDRINP